MQLTANDYVQQNFQTQQVKMFLFKYIPFFGSFLIAVSLLGQAQKIDYSNADNWAVLPGNYPAEMARFGSKSVNDSIDVFFVYPTILSDNKDLRWNTPIDDTLQRKDILSGAIAFQASAWSQAGNVYAPFYRQAHLRSYYTLESGGKEALLFAYEDVKNAFAYYLENFNRGKGIILAGHSQGSTHLSLILRDFFDNQPLQKQLVAAYLPGIGIEKELYATIPLMDSASQIGGFVTWNTFKRKTDHEQYKWYKEKAVINPVTWNYDLVARRAIHKGFLFSNGKMYRQSFTTHIGNGIIWITTPHFPFRYLAFTMKNYHVGDVNLFWEDIRLNALLRSDKYLKNKQKN